MDELIVTRYGLLGAVIMLLMPFVIKFLNAQTENATRHASSEDQREDIMLNSYVKLNERRDTEYVVQVKDLRNAVTDLRAAVDGFPAMIKQELKPMLRLLNDINDRLKGDL